MWTTGCFNSRSREGSDVQPLKAACRSYVSIRAPARGATSDLTPVAYRAPVSIRAPARGATHQLRDQFKITHVSIRAPARGATRAHRWSSVVWVRFNSRSREGSDYGTHGRRRLPARFNSRSREGSDQRKLREIEGKLVSIRAPARGATTTSCSACFCARFQFALPRGERRRSHKPPDLLGGFNSRSREGSDGVMTLRVPSLMGFNSRSREGSDIPKLAVNQRMNVSIRAPARGATKSRP